MESWRDGELETEMTKLSSLSPSSPHTITVTLVIGATIPPMDNVDIVLFVCCPCRRIAELEREDKREEEEGAESRKSERRDEDEKREETERLRVPSKALWFRTA